MSVFYLESLSSYGVDAGAGCILYDKENGEIALVDNTHISDIQAMGSDELSRIQKSLADNGYYKPRDLLAGADALHAPVSFEQLYLILSYGCNLRCKYCRQDMDTHYRNMSIEEIDEAIEMYFSYAKHLDSVVFYGGEPLLNKCGLQYAVEKIHVINPKTRFSIITNAMLCDDETARFLYEHHVDVIVSMDGFAETHNQARVTFNGNGSYDQTFAGYQRVKESGCVVGISCTIGPHNEKHFHELVEWAIRLHPDTIWFGMPHGKLDNYAMGLENFKTIYQNLVDSFTVFQKAGISLLQVEKKIRDILENRINAYDCRACKNRLVVCPGTHYGICEGAVSDSSMFYDSIAGAIGLANTLQKTSPLSNRQCVSCYAQRVCGGGCPYDKLLRYGNTESRDPYECVYMRSIIKYSLQYIASEIRISSNEIHVISAEERRRILDTLRLSHESTIPLQFNTENSLII